MVPTRHFFVTTVRCFLLLKRLLAFLRQQFCSPRPDLFDNWWNFSTLSKRSSVNLASKALLMFPVDPQSKDQQQRKYFNSWMGGREREGTIENNEAWNKWRNAQSQGFCHLAYQIIKKLRSSKSWLLMLYEIVCTIYPYCYQPKWRQLRDLISFLTFLADKILSSSSCN